MKTTLNKIGSISERGFSLVSAIFLLVVIAALGTFAVTLSTTQHQSEAMDVMGKRAYQAARAGVEWGAFQIIQSGVSGTTFAFDCQTPAGTQSSVPLTATTLTSFSPVSVRCSAVSAVDATSVWVYTLSASAVAGGTVGNPDYIERQLSVTMTTN